jgi:replication factor A3
MMNHAFEIVGKVTPDLSVRVDQALDFGTEFGEQFILIFSIVIKPGLMCEEDFNSYEAVINATHRYKQMFYGGES